MNPITGSLVFALAAEAFAGGHYLNRYIALGLFTAGVRALPRKMANVCQEFVTLRLGKLQYVIGVSADAPKANGAVEAREPPGAARASDSVTGALSVVSKGEIWASS